MNAAPSPKPSSKITRPLSCVALLLAGAAAASLASCTSAGSHYEVDAAEVERVTSMPLNTMSACEYVGSTTERSYFKVWDGMPRLLGGGEHVYSVRIDELPAADAATVRSGGNPWKR
jgi:hypothetical protein